MKNWKIVTMILFICSLTLLSACSSSENKIQTGDDLLAYLSNTYKQHEWDIKDTVKQGDYMLIGFEDNKKSPSVGYALLEKEKKGVYRVINSKYEEGSSYLFSIYNDDDIQFLCVVNNGNAKKVVMTIDDKKQQSFDLDKDSHFAYLFPIDYPDAEKYELEFQDKSGKIIE